MASPARSSCVRWECRRCKRCWAAAARAKEVRYKSTYRGPIPSEPSPPSSCHFPDTSSIRPGSHTTAATRSTLSPRDPVSSRIHNTDREQNWNILVTSRRFLRGALAAPQGSPAIPSARAGLPVQQKEIREPRWRLQARFSGSQRFFQTIVHSRVSPHLHQDDNEPRSPRSIRS